MEADARRRKFFRAESRAALRWLLSVTGRTKGGIALLTVLRSVVSLTAVIFALVLRTVIDNAVAGDREAFVASVLRLILLIVIQIAVQALIRRFLEVLRTNTENLLKKRIYKTVLTRYYPALSAYHTGELHNRMTSDTLVITDGLVTIVPDTVSMVVRIIGAAVVLLSLDWRFALIFLIGGGIMLLVTFRFRRKMKELHKSVQEANGAVRSFLQETLGNILVLRSFCSEEKAVEQAGERMEAHKEQRLLRNRFSNFCNIGFSLVMRGGYVFGLVWCGFGILNGSITYGTLTAVLQLVNQIQSPFANMTGYLPKYYSMIASAERLMELEDLPGEDTAEKMGADERAALYRDLARIEVRDVTFAYPDTEAYGMTAQVGEARNRRTVIEAGGAPPHTQARMPDHPLIFSHTSLYIGKGEFIAVTGRSGIGKSTLLKLLLAVYEPQSGTIELLFGHRKPLAAAPATRALFAYVPQGNFLLSGTIREAVSFMEDGRPDEERIRRACRISCADFAEELPEKYDTVIGEKGEGLSEGQAQRLAIARAIYSEAPILLLDESTSALDESTEARLLKNIRKLTDRTVLIVTHRRAALAVCDRVLRMEGQQLTDSPVSGTQG